MSTIDREWFRSVIKVAGFKSQNAFAEAVGLSGDKISKTLKGDRDLRPEEIDQFAAALRVGPSEIKKRFGLPYMDGEELPLSGYVSAAGSIVVLDGAVDDSHEMVMVPFHGYAGVLIEVRGESMLPRYSPGELLGVKPNQPGLSPCHLVGRDVVAKLADGALVVKTLASAPEGKFALLSVNPAVAPIYEDIVWASPIDFHIPRPKK